MINHRNFIIHKPYGTISQFVNPHKRKKNYWVSFLIFLKKQWQLDGWM